MNLVQELGIHRDRGKEIYRDIHKRFVERVFVRDVRAFLEDYKKLNEFAFAVMAMGYLSYGYEPENSMLWNKIIPEVKAICEKSSTKGHAAVIIVKKYRDVMELIASLYYVGFITKNWNGNKNPKLINGTV